MAARIYAPGASPALALPAYTTLMVEDVSNGARASGRPVFYLWANGAVSRTYATLLEALNRHRGKGQQKVTVEHVHVHSGGQAVVGVVEAPGDGDRAKSEDQPHAKQIAHDAPQFAMRRADAACRKPAARGSRSRRGR